MAYTLLDVLPSIEEDKKAGLIKRVFETSPMLTTLETEVIPSGVSTIFEENNLPDPGYRSFNATASDSSGLPDQTITTQLKVLSARIPIDRVLARRETRLGMNYKGKEVDRHIRAMALNWKKYLIGRSPSASDPKGIYGWIDFWNSEVADNKITFATNGSTVATAGAQTTLDKMHQLIDAVYGPDFFLCNRNIINQFASMISTSASNEKFAESFRFDTFEFMPGVTARTGFFENIPMIPVDKDSQDNEIMAFDETTGSSDVTSSIIAVRTGPDETVLLREYADLFDINEFQESGTDVIEIEAPTGVEVRQRRSAARLQGFLTT